MAEFILTDQLIAWGNANGHSENELERQAEWFSDYLSNRKKPYKDNAAAFRNCVRSDWGKIRLQMKYNQKNGIKEVPRGLEAKPGESTEQWMARLAMAQRGK